MKNTKALIKALQTIGLDPVATIDAAFHDIGTDERTKQDIAIIKAVQDDVRDLAVAATAAKRPPTNKPATA